MNEFILEAKSLSLQLHVKEGVVTIIIGYSGDLEEDDRQATISLNII